MYMNKVLLCGMVMEKPELRHTNDNVPVTNFTLKTVDYWFDSAAQSKKSTTKYHKIVCWGNTAKKAVNNLEANGFALVEGELSYHKRTKTDGDNEQVITNTEIKAIKVQSKGGASGYRKHENINVSTEVEATSTAS